MQETANLNEIFRYIKEAISVYEKPPLKAKVDKPGRYDLWSIKNVTVNDKPRNEIYFASAIIQSSYVGFYFMPAYTEDERDLIFSDELLKKLKGKSCFHIKKLNQNILTDINNSLESGFKAYQKRDWV